MPKAASKAKPRQANLHVDEWATWAVRGVLVALGAFITWQVRSVQEIHEDVAVVKTIVASHDAQLREIWERIRKH